MKDKIMTAALLLVILALGFYSIHILRSDSDTLLADLKQLSKITREEGWDRAEPLLKEITEDWGNHKKIWSMLIPHAEISQADIYFSELDTYVKRQNRDETLARISVLISLIGDIPKSETLAPQNII